MHFNDLRVTSQHSPQDLCLLLANETPATASIDSACIKTTALSLGLNSKQGPFQLPSSPASPGSDAA